MGAEKRNTTLWYDNNFVGTELNPNLSYAKVADGCGLKGVTVDSQQALTEALQTAIDEQAKGVTTFIEVVLNQELGEPFRRDAMKNRLSWRASTRPTCASRCRFDDDAGRFSSRPLRETHFHAAIRKDF